MGLYVVNGALIITSLLVLTCTTSRALLVYSQIFQLLFIYLFYLIIALVFIFFIYFMTRYRLNFIHYSRKKTAIKGKSRNRKPKVTEACFFRSSYFSLSLFFLILCKILYTVAIMKTLKQNVVGIVFLHELSALFVNDETVFFGISNL